VEPTTIDISAILRELDVEIAEAQQRYTLAQRELDDLIGQRRGVLLVFERSQRAQTFAAFDVPHVGPPVMSGDEG